MLARFARDRRGAVAVTVAAGSVVLMAAAALAVDLGSVALTARRAQGAADLAALSAARDLDRAEVAARATAQANLPDMTELQVVTGVYAPERERSPEDRFTPGGEVPNAVEVTVAVQAPLHFAHVLLRRRAVTVTRESRAAVRGGPPMAAFSIGSRLASLDGGLANSLLSGLTGSEVELSLLDYDALVDTEVNLMAFADALAHRLELTAGDYDGLLSQTTTSGVALDVLGELTGGRSGDALAGLAQAGGEARIELDRLLGASAEAPDGLRGGLDVDVSAMELATALLEIGAGERQLALDVGAKAGLADLDVILAIGERPNNSPWLAVTADGTPILRTAQARLYLKATTAQKLSGLAQVQLPVLIELAASEARLERIDCPAGAVTLQARPGLASLSLGAVDETRLHDFKREPVSGAATLVNVSGLVRIKGQARVRAADEGWTSARFTKGDIAARRPRTVKTSQAVQSTVSSLLKNLELDVDVLGLGLGLGGLTSALGTLLTPVGATLDQTVNPILELLGLGIGEADLTVHGVTCPAGDGRAAVLVG